ncbi:uncharacterized protein [Dysidea avara]|uniref:uncharacterized protein n=1 Tax=Dysidea avara TaxID=196820 RepID=UPI00332C2255
MTPRVHGNTKSLHHNSLPFGVINAAVKFLQNCTEQHAILLPGRIPGYKKDDMKLLPSSSSKMDVWTRYKDSCIQAGTRYIANTTFYAYWRKLLPHILIARPRTDLCWTCQQNSTSIMRSINKPEDEKSQAIKEAETHIKHVKDERDYYRKACNDRTKSLEQIYKHGETMEHKFLVNPITKLSITVLIWLSRFTIQASPFSLGQSIF